MDSTYLRVDSGFHSGLPGHGVIVEIQDQNNGDPTNNLVNTDPEKAWLKIIEADGDAALQRGRDSGAPGDTFSEGDQLGASGMTNTRQPWPSGTMDCYNTKKIDSKEAIIHFDYPNNPSTVDVLPPRGPLEILGQESILATLFSEYPCQLTIDIFTSTNPGASSPHVVSIDQGESTIELASTNQMGEGSGYVRGTVGCQGEEPWNIDLDWYSIGHRISSEHLTAIIPWDENSQVTLSTSCLGEESRTYSIAVEGALSRISTSSQHRANYRRALMWYSTLFDGLLTPGMIAEGELVFVDSFGLEQSSSYPHCTIIIPTGIVLLGWFNLAMRLW